MCLYCEYVVFFISINFLDVFHLEFSGFVVDFEFFFNLNFEISGEKRNPEIFFLKKIKPIAAF